MSEKITKSDSELYNDIVEMLSNGNFLQLNGKAINLEELNNYINEQQQEIKKLQNIIKEAREYIKQNEFYLDYKTGACIKGVMPLLEILKGEE